MTGRYTRPEEVFDPAAQAERRVAQEQIRKAALQRTTNALSSNGNQQPKIPVRQRISQELPELVHKLLTGHSGSASVIDLAQRRREKGKLAIEHGHTYTGHTFMGFILPNTVRFRKIPRPFIEVGPLPPSRLWIHSQGLLKDLGIEIGFETNPIFSETIIALDGQVGVPRRRTAIKGEAIVPTARGAQVAVDYQFGSLAKHPQPERLHAGITKMLVSFGDPSATSRGPFLEDLMNNSLPDQGQNIESSQLPPPPPPDVRHFF